MNCELWQLSISHYSTDSLILQFIKLFVQELIAIQLVKKFPLAMESTLINVITKGETSSSHSSKYEDDCLIMEAINKSEMPVNLYETTWYNILEGCHLYLHKSISLELHKLNHQAD
jgi:hypothetical protein